MSQYPLTVVEAPSGFGKTTAVREYLHNEHPDAVCAWHTCLGEPSAVAWAAICELFAAVNRKAADQLKSLNMPKMDTLHYIFILRGDAENFLAVFKRIQECAGSGKDPAVQRMANLCLSIISLLLGTKEYVAPWLYDMESIRKSLYVPVIPFTQILHFRLLLMDKRYNELYALIPIALEALEHPYASIQYRMPQLYYYIFLAVAKHNNGETLEAQRYLKEALAIAFPDGVYLPFVDHECMCDLLLTLSTQGFGESCTGDFFLQEQDPAIPFGGAVRDIAAHSFGGRENSFAALLSLCKRQTDGISVIRKALLRSKSPLTPREREVALLAKGRLSAKEIAAKLYISEKTVRWTLSSVYRKLDIHSKSELAGVEF